MGWDERGSLKENAYLCGEVMSITATEEMNARDRKELVEKLRSLEGLTEDEKSGLIGMLNTQKKYGLVWEDKPEDVEEKLRTELPVLREVPERAIISRVADAPNHIVIEGDNLEALTALTFTHAGKIDVIYIDPPYNTGKRDFKYNDDFVDKEDGYRHSKWLSFMSKRLKIAKKLLSDIGVIFISIDDNEQAQLKLLCNEVFGEGNFVAQIVWERAFSPINLMKHFSPSHDYILCYSKNIELSVCHGIKRNEEADNRYSNPDNDPRGVWSSSDISVGPAVEENIYPITTPSGRVVEPPAGRSWRLSRKAFRERLQDNRIWFGLDGDGVPRMKRFLSELRKTGITPMTIWKYTEVDHSQGATKKLAEIFEGEKVIDYPKPVTLIKRCIELYGTNRSIVLDFFAGSGTTMHAVMQLNAEDGGHRRCILVNNNENRICEEVTYERNKRVINGYTTPRGEVVEGLKDNSLRYYKTDFIPRRRSMKNMRALMAASTDLLCVRNDVYKEAPFNGKKLSKKVVRYFEEGDKRMMVIYDERAIFEIVDMIREAPDGGKIIVYVFSPSSDPFRDCFEEVADRVEPVPLPSAIYDAYRRVLPKEAEQPIIVSSDTEEAEL